MPCSLSPARSTIQSPPKRSAIALGRPGVAGQALGKEGKDAAQCPAVRGSAGGTCPGVPKRSVPEAGEDPTFRGAHSAYVAVWCV